MDAVLIYNCGFNTFSTLSYLRTDSINDYALESLMNKQK